MDGGAPPVRRRARQGRCSVHDCHMQVTHRALHPHVARGASHGVITRVAATHIPQAHAAAAERGSLQLPRSGLRGRSSKWLVSRRARGWVGVHGGGQAGRRAVMANWPTRGDKQAGEPRTGRHPGGAHCSAGNMNVCHETKTIASETILVSVSRRMGTMTSRGVFLYLPPFEGACWRRLFASRRVGPRRCRTRTSSRRPNAAPGCGCKSVMTRGSHPSRGHALGVGVDDVAGTGNSSGPVTASVGPKAIGTRGADKKP